MADYNVNMKQWNGTSFDNVLPLAYNAKQLGGQSLDEVKQWVQDNNLLLYTGQYTGTGTYGASNPNSVTIPFSPILFIAPYSRVRTQYANSEGYWQQGVMVVAGTSVDSKIYNKIALGTSSHQVFIYLDADGKTIKFYSDDDGAQQNNKDAVYHFAAIGGYDMGGATEFIITENGNFIVPRTGRYMLELYGGGGGVSNSDSIREGRAVQGGSSCQRYDSISLTAGDSIPITIGVRGTYRLDGTTRDATGTSFGTYSVDGGGAGDGRTATGGSGSGNLGTSGSVINYSTTNKFNNNNGTFGSLYGVGGWGGRSSSSSGGKSGTDGAVYLKYLGA